jgi:multiple sugar transport system permease protein
MIGVVLAFLAFSGPEFVCAPSFAAPAVPAPGVADTTPARVRIKVTEMIVPRDDNMGIAGQAERAVLKGFQDKFPWIDVTRFGGIAIGNAGMETGPLMAIAAGIAPHVLYVNFRKSNSYIMQGFLSPLDEYLKRMRPGELRDMVVPSVEPVLHREGPGGGVHWWALPISNHVITLYYRKDLFHAAGLDPSRPPRTWDELLAYARKLTNPEKGIYGMGFSGGPSASWNFYTFLVSAGARAVEPAGGGKWRAAFNTPGAVEAVYFYTRIIQQEFAGKGRIVNGASLRDIDIYTYWDQGKVAMFEGYLEDKLISTVNPELIGIAPVTTAPGGGMGSEINSRCVGMYAGIKDPRERDAAWEFMRFWAGPEAKRIRIKVYIENGFGQFVNPLDLRKLGFTEYLKRVPKGWEESYRKAMSHGVPEPYGKNCDLVYWYLTKPLDHALVENLGNAPPDRARKRIKELLDTAVADTNERMIGEVPPARMRIRRLVALAAAISVVVSFFFAFRTIMRAFTPEGAKKEWGFRKYAVAYLILLPAVGLMAVWQYLPTIRGAAIAFMDYRIMGDSTWTGLDNFANVLFDNVFWSTLGHSLWYAALSLGLGFAAPIALAILLHEVPRGKIFFRIVFYLPAVVSGLVIIFLWKSFYDPSENGLLNRILGLAHIPPQGWLTNPKLAMLSVILPLVWASLGPGSLLYLAALKTIPEELYEAAEIDGAGVWRKLWNVTIPTIRPLVIISFVGAFIGAFRASDFILAMTGGGPADSTTVLELQIFYDAFLYLRFGPATAMAWLLGFMLLGFTVYQMKRLSNMQFKSVAD